MYCEFSELQDWGKRSGEGRRRIVRYCLKTLSLNICSSFPTSTLGFQPTLIR